MNIDIKTRLWEIQDEYCPLTEEQAVYPEAMQDYVPCGCSICALIRDITVCEIWAEQDKARAEGVKVA